METNWTKMIEQYLTGELNATQRANFEKELANSAELRQELELHQLTHQIIERATLRDLVKQGSKTYVRLRQLKISALVLAVLLVLGAGIFYVVKSKRNTEPAPIESIDASVLKSMQTSLEFDNIAPEYFGFTGVADVFLSESGVLLSVTESSFLQDGKPYSGPAVIQWQEAQEAGDIVKAGLSTMSGDQLLETQGMFSLKAFTPEGKPLDLSNSGVYVQVPVNENKEGMKLFQGVKGKDGQIDWQNPKDLERLPQAKSMHEMDLFPPDYEPKLNELKWCKEKAKRDSLYLSFDLNFENKDTVVPYLDDIYGWNTPTSFFPEEHYEKGKMLFQSKCASCHFVNKNSTGPKLFKVREKWLKGGAKPASIYKWVSNWAEAASVDSYAKGVTNFSATAMVTFPELRGQNEDIDAIFDFIDGLSQPSNIPPSKVLAIWRPKFDGTILATRDFEKRMQAIHRTCNKKVFEVYTSNLNEPLWQKDERVAKMGYSEFKAFAAERVGAMNINDQHARNLAAFYETITNILRNKGKREAEEALAIERKWDDQVNRVRNKQFVQPGLRGSANQNPIGNFNLQNLGRQIGNTVGFQLNSSNNLREIERKSRPITVNLDKYVRSFIASPIPVESFKVNIVQKKTPEFKNFSLKLQQIGLYDKAYMYVVSDQQYSFRRLDFNNGAVSNSLNQVMNYKALVFAMNKDGFHIYEIQNLQAKDYNDIQLEPVDDAEFNKRMQTYSEDKLSQKQAIKNELSRLFKEKQNYKVLEKRKINEQFRNTIRPTIYPCLQIASWIPAIGNDTIESEEPRIENNSEQDKVFTITDTPPEFSSGVIALRKFISNNVQYPENCMEKGETAKIYLKFVVDENGNITDCDVTKRIGSCKEAEQEAIRLVRLVSGKFNPGIVNGKPVKSYYRIPITFSLK